MPKTLSDAVFRSTEIVAVQQSHQEDEQCETRKRRFASDCVVADAVDIEPVF